MRKKKELAELQPSPGQNIYVDKLDPHEADGNEDEKEFSVTAGSSL